MLLWIQLKSGLLSPNDDTENTGRQLAVSAMTVKTKQNKTCLTSCLSQDFIVANN